MTEITWYFDFISPYAYLQQAQLYKIDHQHKLVLKPVLFAGLLNHWGHKGPAEIPSKRSLTYTHVLWLARHNHLPFKMPPAHPFNPLRALRLAILADATPSAVRDIFYHIWGCGHSLDDPEAWQALTTSLGVQDADQAISQSWVKNTLRENTEEAIAQGVFGVPTAVVNQRLFWGVDQTDMLLDYLNAPEQFDDPEMRRALDLPIAKAR